MPIKAVVFDAYDTLVDNQENWWLKSFGEICRNQRIEVAPQILWRTWITLEKQFRSRRLNLQTLQPAEPFERYEEVWLECFQKSFLRLNIPLCVLNILESDHVSLKYIQPLIE